MLPILLKLKKFLMASNDAARLDVLCLLCKIKQSLHARIYRQGCASQSKNFKRDGSSLPETFVRMQSNMLMYISIFETLNRPIQGKWSTYMFHFDVE